MNEMKEQNPYEILVVSESASDADIKRAYKQAARGHPDRNPGDDGATDRMTRVNAAYDALRTPEGRAKVDACISGGRLHKHACRLVANGRWSEAEPLFRDALRLREEGGETSTNRARTMNRLGQVLRTLGRWPEAEPLLRNALRLGGDTMDSGVVMIELAQGLRDNGRWSEAEPLLRSALRLQEQDGPTLLGAITMHHLALGLLRNGRWPEAEPLFREALRLALKDGDMLVSGFTMDGLAQGLRDNGRRSEAEHLFREARRLQDQGGITPPVRGPHDPRSGAARLDLERGEMKAGNGYLEQIKQRLGDKDTGAKRAWNDGVLIENYLQQADTKSTIGGVTTGEFSGRADGLKKVVIQPDGVSGVRGGRHSRAIFENNPDGILQVDDYADGTRWVRERPVDEPESRSAFFPDGTDYTFISETAWVLTFRNGNYIVAYLNGDVAREICENGKVTQVLRDGTSRLKPS